MRTRARPECPVCGGPGGLRHRGLQDRASGTPGAWDMRQCARGACGCLWLDPAPVEEDLWKAYQDYYTHSETTPAWPRGPWGRLARGYLGWRWGYRDGTTPMQRALGAALLLDPGRRAGADFSVMYLPARAGGRLLEVGCGSGWMLEGLSRLGWQTQGVELDPVAVGLSLIHI